RRANRGVARELEASHHDSSAIEALAQDLEAAHPDLAPPVHALLDAGRDGEATYGRPLNYAVLRFAGKRVLLLDDDVVLDARRAPPVRAGVGVGAAPEAAFWYETLDAAYAACPPLERNPVEEHLRWLGLPLAKAWSQAERDPAGLSI